MPTQATPPEWTKLVPPIFAECVDSENPRWAFSSPFLKPDGYLYAANASIAVRMLWDGEWTYQAEGRTPDMRPVFSGMDCLADPISAPMPTGACPKCNGLRRLAERECEKCKGTGKIDVQFGCECPHCLGEHPCPECDGERRLGPCECPSCSGWGITDPWMPIKIAPGVLIARHYAVTLATHSAKLYLLKPAPGEGRIRFEFGIVEGVLMRIHDEEPDR
jgi:hypothetical protein